MDQSELIYNYEVTNSLSHAISSGEHGLGNVPGLLKKIIRDGCWKERFIQQTKQIVKFEKFAEFVVTQPLEGLGSDIKTLRRLCADDLEALDELEKAVQGRHGGDHGNQHTGGKPDIVSLASEDYGNSRTSALRRLRKDRPDLHAQVIEKKLSPHTAMVEAGFRRKLTTVEQMKKLWLKMTPEEKEQFQIWATEQLC